jgi:hypothetical protein
MVEYPSIPNSSKAPRKECIAFEKLDGSNFRAKYTLKNGFQLFGTRTQLIDETSEWKNMIECFKEFEEPLLNKFKKDKDYNSHREIIVFGEYYGENSFAGSHNENDKKKITIFDILIGHKIRKFIPPKKFIKDFKDFNIPKVIYEGNLNDEFILNVRNDKYNTFEGVICKGTIPVGNAMGGIWMCKIKTQKYLDRLKNNFGDNWINYSE